jgi:hypothetical protein
LHNTTNEIFKELEKTLNVPNIIEQLQIQQQHFFQEKNKEMTLKKQNWKKEIHTFEPNNNIANNDNNNNNNNKYLILPIFNKNINEQNNSTTTTIIEKNDKWVRDIIPNFKVTQMEKTEGINKILNEIRISLNKISKKNFDIQKEKIYELIENVLNESKIMTLHNENEEVEKSLENKDKDEMLFFNEEDYKNEMEVNLQKISQFIFEIASSNKFFCELYANLYKELIDKYSFFSNILISFILHFKESIQHFIYCDPNEDYEKYCNFVKESDKKKATTTFIIMLLERNVIKEDIVIEMIHYFNEIVIKYIDEQDKLNEVEELGEILHIFISLGKKTLCFHSNWVKIVEYVQLVSSMRVKEHISISSRFIFKMQDIQRGLLK